MKTTQQQRGKPSTGGKPGLSLVIEQDPHSLREKTVSKLREAIIAGYFAPGEQLVERDICAKTDVSRSSLREALRHLESEGLVESRKGEGVFVKVLSLDDVRDIYEVRMTLDAEAVRLFSERASAADKLRLKTLTDQLDKLDYSDFRKVLASTNEFFSVIYEGAGNKLSRDIIRSLQTRISLLRAITSRSSNKERHMESLALTQEITAEIGKGNSRKAAQLARQYAARSQKFALKILAQHEADSDVRPASRAKRMAEKQ